MNHKSNDPQKTEPKPQTASSEATVPETRLKIRSKVRTTNAWSITNANETLLG